MARLVVQGIHTLWYMIFVLGSHGAALKLNLEQVHLNERLSVACV